MGPLRPSGLGHVWKGERGLSPCLALRPASVPGPSPCECLLALEVVETTTSLLGSTCDCFQVTACTLTRGSEQCPSCGGWESQSLGQGGAWGCLAPLVLCTQQPPQPGMGRGAPRAQAGKAGRQMGGCFARFTPFLVFCLQKGSGAGKPH